MKVSFSWLSAYGPIEMETFALADALTMTGLEVEAVADRYAYLKNVRVGRIVAIEAHPDADNLSCCQVDIGNRRLSIVCGAPNIENDLVVPTALPGTILPGGPTITQSVIRGVPSEGMLCSEAELNLGLDKSGLMILDPALKIGEPLAEALRLSDMVFEIGLTPNRSDCLSITGVAREIAAIQKTKIKLPEVTLPETKGHIFDLTSVMIQAPTLCPRYDAGLLRQVVVGPSPFWLQDRLNSIGVRPINNIVDITNFVMLELGQPLHAFDFDRLAGGRIVVRRAVEGEVFVTLDQKDHRLSSDMLMICDADKPVAVAGIMGGLNSEIEATTQNVLIESAYFDPVTIRKTSKKLGLNTDASFRFARGVDPAGTMQALKRAAQLMTATGGGQLVGGLIDEHPRPASDRRIPLTTAAVNRLLGTCFNTDEIQSLLEAVEFSVDRKKDPELVVVPPSFRVDVERPEDLMEEVARLSGYQNIPTTFPLISAAAGPPLGPLTLRNRIKHLLTGFGFTEAINYSFTNRNYCDRLKLGPDEPRRAMLDILNPLSEEQTVMRTSLIPGLLETMHRNLAQQNRNLKCFEIGKIFLSKGQDHLPEEFEMAAGLWTGSRRPPSWLVDDVECDFYDIKGIVEGLLRALGVAEFDFRRPRGMDCSYTRPGYSARIFAGKRPLGLVGRIDAVVLHHFDLKQNGFIFELDLAELSACVPAGRTYQPIAKFPATARDLTLIIDKKIAAGDLIRCIKDQEEDLVESIRLLAVYDKKPIPAGKKSISIRITYRSVAETLEDERVNVLHRAITERILEEFDATLPP